MASLVFIPPPTIQPVYLYWPDYQTPSLQSPDQSTKKSGSLSLVGIVEIVPSLVESFIELNSYAIKNQLVASKAPSVVLYGIRDR